MKHEGHFILVRTGEVLARTALRLAVDEEVCFGCWCWVKVGGEGGREREEGGGEGEGEGGGREFEEERGEEREIRITVIAQVSDGVNRKLSIEQRGENGAKARHSCITIINIVVVVEITAATIFLFFLAMRKERELESGVEECALYNS